MEKTELKFDMRSTALVLIDLQNGIVSMDVHPQPSSQVLANARLLADAFVASKAPVVFITVGNHPDGCDTLIPPCDAGHPPASQRPDDWSHVAPELADVPGAIQIMKRQWGGFYGTDLDLQLRRRGVSTLVVAGISTHVGVESTARDAFERGYSQVFVSDAMASPSAEAHGNTLKYVFPRLGRIRGHEEVLMAIEAAALNKSDN